jgi:hypothetical protein
MPAKVIKIFGSGIKVELKAIRLANGNLLIAKRMDHDRTQIHWAEVSPGTSDFKRWSSVVVDEPDPREHPEYKKWLADVQATESYKKHHEPSK